MTQPRAGSTWQPLRARDRAFRLAAGIILWQRVAPADKGNVAASRAQRGQSVQLGDGKGLSFQLGWHKATGDPPQRGGLSWPMSRITVPVLYTAQLFGWPEMGFLIVQPHEFDPSWKCLQPPAAMISVLSNSALASTPLVDGQMPRLRQPGPDLCLGRTASPCHSHPETLHSPFPHLGCTGNGQMCPGSAP